MGVERFETDTSEPVESITLSDRVGVSVCSELCDAYGFVVH
jgi:hypothetical protein